MASTSPWGGFIPGSNPGSPTKLNITEGNWLTLLGSTRIESGRVGNLRVSVSEILKPKGFNESRIY